MENCGTKHLKLVLALVGTMILMFSTVLGYTVSRAGVGDLGEVEIRVRALEKDQGRIDERLKRIEVDVQWIRDRMEKGREP